MVTLGQYVNRCGEQMSNVFLVTTYPNWSCEVYSNNFLRSFFENTSDIILALKFDEDENLPYSQGQLFHVLGKEKIDQLIADKMLFLHKGMLPQEKIFFERHKDNKIPDNKELRYVTYAYKAFQFVGGVNYAITREDLRYVVWCDADCVFKEKLSNTNIQEMMDGRGILFNQDKSFIIVDARDLNVVSRLNAIMDDYMTDTALTYSKFNFNGIFDEHFKEKSQEFPFIEHKNSPKDKFLGVSGKTIDFSSLKIQTKNCVDGSQIIDNVKKNCRLIKNWLQTCQYNDETVVLCSAGPSLNAHEIKTEWYDKGYKIVAVKHAMEDLLAAGVIPWACILLDPREHVKEFVKNAPKETRFFVASMVNPETTQILLDNGNEVWGWHAYVNCDGNAGECEAIREAHEEIGVSNMLITGGTATSTRGINLLYDLGFKNLQLYAYDLCAFEKPDLEKFKENGRPHWEEMTLSVIGWGHKEFKRTFWTKGEFLAQLQEFRDYYWNLHGINIQLHGEGIVSWIQKHTKKRDAYIKEYGYNTPLVMNGRPNVNEFLKDKI